MRFARALAAHAFPVALEITPPQRSLPAVLRRRAGLLDPWAAAVNVIQRPGRQPSLDASIELLAGGIQPAWHLVTRGRTRADVAADLTRAKDAGISQVLCLRGDHAASDPPGAATIREAAGMARDLLPGALIGATLNQYAPDRDAVLRNLLPKLRAGASYVQTQPVFDVEQLRPLAEAVQDTVAGTAIVAMAMPLLSLEAVEKIAARLGFAPPPALAPRLGGDGSGAWPAFTETIQALFEAPFVDGVAIMTFEMDPPAETGIRIVAALQAAGLAPPVC